MTAPHFIWDTWGFLLITGDPKSWKDAIGRLMEYLYAHGKFHEKNEALESCLIPIIKKEKVSKEGSAYTQVIIGYKLLRHPVFRKTYEDRITHGDPDPTEYKYDKLSEIFASRDHWSYFIQYKKNTLTPDEFADFISKVPRMRGMNLWMKTMKGNKWGEWWFYTLFNPGAYLGNIVSNLITWIGRLGPEESIWWWIEPETVSIVGFTDKKLDVNKGTKMQWSLTRWQKRWRGIWTFVIAFYPTQNRAWQLKWLPESKRKTKQKCILLRRTDRGNIIVRALLGDTHISDLELQKYPEVTGDRSGVKLNRSCDRVIEKIHNTENCYKKKLAWKLHNENIK